jgi:hypothetical protein
MRDVPTSTSPIVIVVEPRMERLRTARPRPIAMSDDFALSVDV